MPISSALTEIDWQQLAVAAVATGSYAATSIVLRRAVAKRRRREAWRDARFVSRLVERAGDGSVQTLSDVTALYREAGGVIDRNHHRLEWLLDRATARLRRRSERSRERGRGDLEPRSQRAAERIEQLSASCRAAWMDDAIRNARVAAEDVDRMRLEVERHIRDAAASSQPSGERRKRRARQRRTASLVRRGVVGAGCIAFVQMALVVWHSLR